MKYLERLKSQKMATRGTAKSAKSKNMPDVELIKKEKVPTQITAKSAKTPFDGFDSNPNEHISKKNDEIKPFDSFDSAPAGIVFENPKPNKKSKKFKPVTPPFVKNFKAARPWILNHLPELEAAGWTRKQLFGAGRFKYPCGTWGPAWLSVWADPDMTPEIDQDGTLVFNFNKNGRQYRQTTRKEFYEKQHV